MEPNRRLGAHGSFRLQPDGSFLLGLLDCRHPCLKLDALREACNLELTWLGMLQRSERMAGSLFGPRTSCRNYH
jgi:hypothetical protein